ncbi:MAG: GtrA family protein [Terricaulis silvestris]
MAADLLVRISNHEMTRQFLRFAAVGAVATVVHYAILISLKEGAGLTPVAATTAGYTFGALLSYTLNRRFTFATRPSFGRGLLKYAIVIAMGAVINAGIVATLTRLGLHYLLAQVIATGLVMIWNFAASRLVVFRA